MCWRLAKVAAQASDCEMRLSLQSRSSQEFNNGARVIRSQRGQQSKLASTGSYTARQWAMHLQAFEIDTRT